MWSIKSLFRKNGQSLYFTISYKSTLPDGPSLRDFISMGIFFLVC